MDSKPLARVTRRQFVTTSAAAIAAGSLAAGFVSPGCDRSRPGTVRPEELVGGPFRVIIDTDPGVDDALALLLAMRSPELKIEGITPVAGNVPLDLTLPNALRMVEIAGRTDIPVAAGARAPLVRRLVTAAYAHGENGLGGAVFPEPKTKPIAQPAAEFIRAIVRKYPGEVTLIPIGPLTNIATALNLDSELAGMVRGIVLMGGSLSGGNITPAAEFNIYVDPEAARIVFQSGIPITMVGLDATRKTSLTEDHVRTLEAAQNPVSQAAAKIGRNAINHNREQGFLVGPNMHDSLAVAAFPRSFHPEVQRVLRRCGDYRRAHRGRDSGLQSKRRRPAAQAGNGKAGGCHEHVDSRLGADTRQHPNLAGVARQIRAQCQGRVGCGFRKVFRPADWSPVLIGARVGAGVRSKPSRRRGDCGTHESTLKRFRGEE